MAIKEFNRKRNRKDDKKDGNWTILDLFGKKRKKGFKNIKLLVSNLQSKEKSNNENKQAKSSNSIVILPTETVKEKLSSAVISKISSHENGKFLADSFRKPMKLEEKCLKENKAEEIENVEIPVVQEIKPEPVKPSVVEEKQEPAEQNRGQDREVNAENIIKELIEQNPIEQEPVEQETVNQQSIEREYKTIRIKPKEVAKKENDAIEVLKEIGIISKCNNREVKNTDIVGIREVISVIEKTKVFIDNPLKDLKKTLEGKIEDIHGKQKVDKKQGLDEQTREDKSWVRDHLLKTIDKKTKNLKDGVVSQDVADKVIAKGFNIDKSPELSEIEILTSQEDENNLSHSAKKLHQTATLGEVASTIVNILIQKGIVEECEEQESKEQAFETNEMNIKNTNMYKVIPNIKKDNLELNVEIHENLPSLALIDNDQKGKPVVDANVFNINDEFKVASCTDIEVGEMLYGIYNIMDYMTDNMILETFYDLKEEKIKEEIEELKSLKMPDILDTEDIIKDEIEGFEDILSGECNAEIAS